MARVPKKYRKGRERLLVRAADGSYWLDRPYNSGGAAGRVSTNYRPVRNIRQAHRWAVRIGRAHGQVEIIRRFFSGKRKRVEMVYLFNPTDTTGTWIATTDEPPRLLCRVWNDYERAVRRGRDANSHDALVYALEYVTDTFWSYLHDRREVIGDYGTPDGGEWESIKLARAALAEATGNQR